MDRIRTGRALTGLEGEKVKSYLATMCVAAVFPATAFGQIQVAGTVRDANNTPLAGARITVRLAVGEPVQGFSDPGGRFLLRVIGDGRYEIVAEKESYYPARMSGDTLDAGGCGGGIHFARGGDVE